MINEWIDCKGKVVKIGGYIRFFTLYGTVTAKVVGIRPNNDPFSNPIAANSRVRESKTDFESPVAVEFEIEPLQVGHSDAFKPLRKVETHYAWGIIYCADESDYLKTQQKIKNFGW